jgi:ribosome biogenesis GTPase A
MVPKVETTEIGYKLCLIHSIKDNILGENLISDYLLFLLNNKKKFSYMKLYNLKEPIDNFDELLKLVGNNENDYHKITIKFLENYRLGNFGKFTLDEIN